MFEKGELEKLLGVQKINNKELEERLKHLMGNVVKIPDTDDKKGFRLVSLFEEAVAEQDDYGLWQVKLECTQKAMKYIFNIENLGYLRYKLRCITSITSRYTYIMFIYLESNRFRKSWEVSLEELKKILNCDKEELYKEFKFFNQKILKRTQAEMHEKTECRYDYEPIKRGRSVVAIRFTVETLQLDTDDDGEQMTIEDYVKINSETPLWQEALPEGWFSPEEIELIGELICQLPDEALPPTTVSWQNIEFQREAYISAKIKLMQVYNAKKTINLKCKYLCSMIKNDIKN
jgi:hypothetical protein